MQLKFEQINKQKVIILKEEKTEHISHNVFVLGK
jgi:hypothetical protein